MILVIYNYLNSFTYSLVEYLVEMKVGVQVHRNDQISIDQIRDLKPERILLFPGLVRRANPACPTRSSWTFGPQVPVFGVCLGHQCIGHNFRRQCHRQ